MFTRDKEVEKVFEIEELYEMLRVQTACKRELEGIVVAQNIGFGEDSAEYDATPRGARADELRAFLGELESDFNKRWFPVQQAIVENYSRIRAARTRMEAVAKDYKRREDSISDLFVAARKLLGEARVSVKTEYGTVYSTPSDKYTVHAPQEVALNLVSEYLEAKGVAETLAPDVRSLVDEVTAEVTTYFTAAMRAEVVKRYVAKLTSGVAAPRIADVLADNNISVYEQESIRLTTKK